jgi:hypothetical protein
MKDDGTGVTRSLLLMPVLLAAFLAGCAALGGGVEGARLSWESASYQDLVAQWGKPNRSAALEDGGIVHTWISPTSGVGAFVGSGGAGVGGTFSFSTTGGGDPQKRCERILTFKEGYVIRQEWHGTAEFCSPFKRR